MTRFKYIAITTFICLLLQTTLINYIAINGVKPLLLIAVSVCALLNYGPITGAATGIVCGLLMDITSGRGVGLSALLLMYICIGLGILCPRIFKEKTGVVVLFTFGANLIFELLYSFFIFLAWGKGGIDFILLSRILPESFFTSIFAIPIFLIFKRVKNTEWTNE